MNREWVIFGSPLRDGECLLWWLQRGQKVTIDKNRWQHVQRYLASNIMKDTKTAFLFSSKKVGEFREIIEVVR